MHRKSNMLERGRVHAEGCGEVKDEGNEINMKSRWLKNIDSYLKGKSIRLKVTGMKCF